MKAIMILFLLCMSQLLASQKLVFGAISTVSPEVMQKHLSPLLRYLEKSVDAEISFQTGYDYQSTVNAFVDGGYDLGYIGPAPYVLATEIDKNALIISAGLNNKDEGYFHSVIVTAKHSQMENLEDLEGAKFAFGSPLSTLSFYVPMQMLLDAKILQRVRCYDYLGRHDRVAKYVILGKYDAGAIKESVAKKYAPYLKVIAKSEPIPDFMIVVSSKMDKNLALKIQTALYNLKDPTILQSIKASAVGFIPRQDSDYNHLREIMRKTSSYK